MIAVSEKLSEVGWSVFRYFQLNKPKKTLLYSVLARIRTRYFGITSNVYYFNSF